MRIIHRRRILPWHAFVALAVLACADSTEPTQVTAAPASPAGCYDVRLGKWSGKHDSPDPPSPIVLLETIGTSFFEKGFRIAREHPGNTLTSFDTGRWSAYSPEHLEIMFAANGEIGVNLHLVWGWGDSTWRGTAEAFTDVSPGLQAVATVALVPRSCS